VSQISFAGSPREFSVIGFWLKLPAVESVYVSCSVVVPAA
jgi:hypothetical protein